MLPLVALVVILVGVREHPHEPLVVMLRETQRRHRFVITQPRSIHLQNASLAVALANVPRACVRVPGRLDLVLQQFSEVDLLEELVLPDVIEARAAIKIRRENGLEQITDDEAHAASEPGLASADVLVDLHRCRRLKGRLP